MALPYILNREIPPSGNIFNFIKFKLLLLIVFWTIWFSYLETPETSKIWIWGSVIELIITPFVMRYFTIKWNEIQFK